MREKEEQSKKSFPGIKALSKVLVSAPLVNLSLNKYGKTVHLCMCSVQKNDSVCRGCLSTGMLLNVGPHSLVD